MRYLVLIAWLAASAARSAAAQPSAPLLFDVEALSSWQPLAKAETLPYHSEGLQSELLFAARSRQGSYAFVTRIDDTVRRPALAVEDLAAVVSADSFSSLHPTRFQSEIETIEASDGSDLRCIVSTFQTRNLGYAVGAGAGEATVRTVFLPVVLWHRPSESYWNVIYVANFRSQSENRDDLLVFERMWRRVSIPEELSLVKRQRFNALQPELAAIEAPEGGERQPEARRDSEGLDGQPLEQEGDARAIAGALLEQAAGNAAATQRRLLDRLAKAQAGTVLAEVISALDRQRDPQLEQEVWNHVLASSDDAARNRLVALFLAASIDVRDWRAAELLAADSTKASLSLASFGPDELGLILDRILRLRMAEAPAGTALRDLLSLDPRSLQQLASLLQMKGFAIPDLDVLADRNHRGLWHLRNKQTLDAPMVARSSGKLVLVQGAPGPGRGLEIIAVTSLLQLAGLGQPAL